MSLVLERDPVATGSASLYRTATPEQTMRRVQPVLETVGITRVADITRLDDLSLPTYVAYRPCGRTLSASIGIGLAPEQAWVSAVMESIETWHAENLDGAFTARAGELDLPYDWRTLDLAPRSLFTCQTMVPWVQARGILSGVTTAVPLGLVRLDSTSCPDWTATLFSATSNGLASGNTRSEAILHGLLEVIERDCCAPVTELSLGDRRAIDPAAVPEAAPVLQALRAADCYVEVFEATNTLGVPAYTCSIWSPANPIYFSGFGCHLDAALAVTRALHEAVLSRLATVSGARDDIDELFYANAEPTLAPTLKAQKPFLQCGTRPSSIDSAIALCAERIAEHTGAEPMAVELTRPELGVPVVKVVAPGLRMFDDFGMASRPGEQR